MQSRQGLGNGSRNLWCLGSRGQESLGKFSVQVSFNPVRLPTNFTKASTPHECFWSEPYSQEIWIWAETGLRWVLGKSWDPMRPSPVCVTDVWKERWVQCVGILNICSLCYLLLSWILLNPFQVKDFIMPDFYIWGLTFFFIQFCCDPRHNFFFDVTLNLRMLIPWFWESKMYVVLQSERRRNHWAGSLTT